MLPLEKARALVLEGLCPLPAVLCGLDDALGRVLAEPVEARWDLPPFDASAMDGYALRAAETERAREGGVVLPVAFEVAAGVEAPPPLPEGQAARIFTGARLPEGADAVVMQERSEALDGAVRVQVAVAVGENVRPRGDAVRAGERVLEAGMRLGPLELSTALSQGRTLFPVHRRPRVSLFTSGDELVAPDRPPRPGGIVSSNSQALLAACRLEGAWVDDLGIAPDRPEAIAGLVAASTGSDVVISSGGVSVGEHDHVRAVLGEAGLEEVFWRVAMKPGKPVLFGRLPGRLFFGLPGNPVSALVGFYLFVRPVLRLLQGLPALPPRSRATLAETAPAARGRAQILFVRRDGDDAARVRPLPRQASHRSAASAGAEGFVVVPPDSPLPAGAEVEVEWIRAMSGSPSDA